VPNLTHLNLSLTRITNRTLRSLSSCSNLRELNLRCCNALTSDAFNALKRRLSSTELKGQETIAEDGSGCDNVDWLALRRHTQLKDLAKFKGFKGLPGEAVAKVVIRLQPFTNITFLSHLSALNEIEQPSHQRVTRGQTGLGLIGPNGSSKSIALTVDEEGCVA